MKNVNTMGLRQFFGRGFTKKQDMGNCLKRGFEQFAGVLGKNRDEGVFERG